MSKTKNQYCPHSSLCTRKPRPHLLQQCRSIMGEWLKCKCLEYSQTTICKISSWYLEPILINVINKRVALQMPVWHIHLQALVTKHVYNFPPKPATTGQEAIIILNMKLYWFIYVVCTCIKENFHSHRKNKQLNYRPFSQYLLLPACMHTYIHLHDHHS